MAQPTKVVNGRRYFAKLVNYTTGPAISWMTFPEDEKRYNTIVNKHKAAINARLKSAGRTGFSKNSNHINSGYQLEIFI